MAKKIALLIDRLNSGGAEKMVANLSKSFVAKGYDVTTIIMRDDVAYAFDGQLYNFGKIKAGNSKFKALQLLKSFIKTQNFNVIFDHRVRMFWLKEFVLSKFVFKNCRVIYVVHHYLLSKYFPTVKFPFLSKQTLVKNREIIAVSKAAQTKIKQRFNINSELIYNYPETKKVNTIKLHYKYIIAVGRLEKIKQFDVLIDCYQKSQLHQQNIKLLIFGEGSEKEYLQDLINKNQLQDNITLKGFNVNVASYIKSAQALVMTSKAEGFPMVLIEAIQLKTPVISFDCKSGPSEIIKNGINGLLVKDQNVEDMISKLNKLLDENICNDLMSNLETYNLPFTEERIIEQWIAKIES